MNGQKASLKSRPRFFCTDFFLRLPFLAAVDFRRGADFRAEVRLELPLLDEALEGVFLAAIMRNKGYCYEQRGCFSTPQHFAHLNLYGAFRPALL